MMVLLLVGLAMTAFCLGLQAGSAYLAQRYFVHARHKATRRRIGQGYLRISIVMVLLMLGIVVQMAVWAALYRLGGLFASTEEAMYFSGVTFTSLGYGDVVIHDHARFLAPMEAANGLMMFAIVTAVLIGVIQREAKPGE
ncbi:MAG: hypothetical protein CFE37_11150 [Alphaproteobacteria bacterium PA4]|nr:MAG: hypothetical protein CFE37_11150 [Alphaproteobacteria bacterium PA4]